MSKRDAKYSGDIAADDSASIALSVCQSFEIYPSNAYETCTSKAASIGMDPGGGRLYGEDSRAKALPPPQVQPAVERSIGTGLAQERRVERCGHEGVRWCSRLHSVVGEVRLPHVGVLCGFHHVCDFDPAKQRVRRAAGPDRP